MQLVNTTNDAIKLRIAAQVAPRRWRVELDRLREKLEQGSDWPTAIAAVAKKQPELADLLSAALAAGHPASITAQLIQQRAASRASWQHLLTALVYPLGLMIVALVVGSLLSMSMMSMATQDWGFSENSYPPIDASIMNRAHDFYDASVGGLMLVVWCVVLVLVTYAIATPNAWLKLLSGIPIFGRPYRWMELSELLTRISVFSQYQPSLDKTLELTERSFGKQALAAISRYLAQAVQQGEALPNALHKTIVSDARVGMALTLIENNDLTASTLRASKLVDEMILATCNQLRLIMPVFIMLMVASFIWGAWSSYFELMTAFQKMFY